MRVKIKELSRLKMEPSRLCTPLIGGSKWRAGGSVVADSYHLDEEQDPEKPDL
jgi:hypothetical protein